MTGAEKPPIGAGEYPRPPALRSAAIAATSDGEVFYHIRNGIRNTGDAGVEICRTAKSGSS